MVVDETTKNKIVEIILSTLVVENKKSIPLTADKIAEYLNKKYGSKQGSAPLSSEKRDGGV